MSAQASGALDFYDNQNGSVLAAWAPFPGINPASYNVYVNGVLNQNVPTRLAQIAGLTPASYSASTVPPTPNNSTRPESMPPVGKITDPVTVNIRIAAVVGGVEVATVDANFTPQPQTTMLVTPTSRGGFAFPQTPGGY